MFITLENIPIHYEIFGDESAPHALFLHGWGANIGLYKPLISALAKKYRVFALEFPGCGQSGEPNVPWTLTDYVELILAFMANLNIKNPVLAGHSHGGRCCLKLVGDGLLRPPKMLLFDSAGVVGKKPLKKQLRTLTYKTVRRALTLPVARNHTRDLLEKARAHYGSADYKSASEVMRKTLVSLVNTDLRELFPKISCPTLLIWGENDTDTPLSDGRLMEKLIPDAGLCVLKGAGHFAFLEKPYDAERIIDAFV
ncbi:MAG: alpha/beta hydrolase [Oscillospiraceae bacterium]|jgi:pimeloyl-ACP methyl ester carboxylesterase|nr:alpha/beta hydrolase [Oscillospiraceae bacterium]